jgi:phosphoglycolate phosphatase-like HAD superfamily hydrolase
MIGDRLSDMQAGERAGCHVLQLTTNTNLPELADIAIKIIRKASA